MTRKTYLPGKPHRLLNIAGSTEPSSVLLDMGLGRELALGALRLTLGRWSTPEEIDTAAELIVEQVKKEFEQIKKDLM